LTVVGLLPLPRIALTATADVPTRREIADKLLIEPRLFVASFDRPNIRYTIVEKRDSLRQLLLHPARPLTARAEALLFAAARAQLLAECIRPALAAGAVVLCDRYVDASLAYQGAGLGLGYAAVAALNQFATEGLRPHLTVLLDVPVEVGQARLRQRNGTGADRIEQRGPAFFERVRAELLRIAAAEPERVVVLDGTAPLTQLEQEIWRQVANRLGHSSGQGSKEFSGEGEWP
ncbi:MAG: dTMP kinase, partial [Alicyclobacillus sp.]|nr:dTMP kinase [Alicyclobacillus sp.]